MLITTTAFQAWLAWDAVVSSLWGARKSCRHGAQFELGMNYVRGEALRMRAALCAEDWQRACVHGLRAQNAIQTMTIEILAPIAEEHPRKALRLARANFQVELRAKRARYLRLYQRTITHEEADLWAGKSGLVPEKLATRTLQGWISDILGPPPRGRPPGKKK